MTEMLTEQEEGRDSQRSQYQHQILTLNNTAGMVLMSLVALALLVALLRQDKRIQELAEKLAEMRTKG
jgi:hypothetical protein